jgi:hypothetical protein
LPVKLVSEEGVKAREGLSIGGGLSKGSGAGMITDMLRCINLAVDHEVRFSKKIK